jgi:hypothetical protein
MTEESLDKPSIDKEELQDKANKDPKSKKWNNANSRRNLKQYQVPITPEIVDSEQEDSIEDQVSSLVIGRKLKPELVKKLMPERGVFTAAEKKRYLGIVQQFLGDFKNEEPTASDIDDIFEIAEADIQKTRLLRAAKDSPDAIVNINQALERIYKRKQSSKENLSARRLDRKDARSSQDLNIVDLIVRYDMEQKKKDEDRIAALLEEEEEASRALSGVLDKDGY